jgi:hypothetical protein
MKQKVLIACMILILLSPLAYASETVWQSTADDQAAVEVTVYNSNLGLIKDTRNISIPYGEGALRFMDVASQIQPETVHVKSLNHPDNIRILEQNYEYDLMNQNKLLDKYVGKKIKIIDSNKFQDRKDIIEATLLSNNRGQIYKIKDEIYLGHPGIKVLPGIPENLIAKPTLTWLYDNSSKNPHKLEVSYLTDKINWKADYIVVLHENDTSSDISGWVTIDNQSGATYTRATLKLIAGEVHRTRPGPQRRVYALEAAQQGAAPQFEEKAFFEYHIYDLQRKTTLKDRQTKQIRLFEASGVKTRKEFLSLNNKSYFTRRYQEKKLKQPVDVYIKFKNSSDNNLGMPLPEGIMRFYKQDHKGSQQFIGEDKIQHTPKNEEIKLRIGKAFDVVSERKQTDFKKITSQRYESEWEITLRNHKKTGITVGVIEPLPGNWQITKNNYPYKKVDAFTVRFDVKVPSGKEIKVQYKVRVGL